MYVILGQITKAKKKRKKKKKGGGFKRKKKGGGRTGWGCIQTKNKKPNLLSDISLHFKMFENETFGT